MNCGLASVIIPVYKTPYKYLLPAVESIINQTYKNIEILMVVDGDAKIAFKVKHELNDKRINVLVNKEDHGLPYSLNRGIAEAKGQYIVRMDGDDISRSNRIERQINYLIKHSDVDLVGCYAETFGEQNVIYASTSDFSSLSAELLFKNPIVHPTVIMKKEVFEKYNLHYTNGESEDYRLWLLMVFRCGCKIEVVPEVLLDYRIHGGQKTILKSSIITDLNIQITDEICEMLNVDLSDTEKKVFCKLRSNVKTTVWDFMTLMSLNAKFIKMLPDYISKTTVKKMVYKCYFRSLMEGFK